MGKKKGCRDRGWKADEHLKLVKRYKRIVGGRGKVSKKKLKPLVKWMYQWTRDMHTWGECVRDDIIRLEAAVGLPPGDPGDPPGGPPD